MAEDHELILQIVDQVQLLGSKMDKMNLQVQKLIEEQNQATHVLASFFSITTTIEAATALAVGFSALSLFLTARWRNRQPHDRPLPIPSRIPKPKRVVVEEEEDTLRRYAPKAKDRPIDTLAELAQELNGRRKG